ncbi:hypothetical protein [Nostoc sp. 106C]|jgi:hypothetical protein|uniref:hypothetical protein n=1 Tax=Nostoc sp. 106C TaxID=1932667 RepID=UPI000A398810|nr:hypothetical protein [Nostoc sp. 106C]OUL24558.1 hypothetical protein BV378_19475 [Nostoc sp. RF31YmG]OUL25826.1 hypothetical protein BV375_22200 [Nostoc sp. 106C]
MVRLLEKKKPQVSLLTTFAISTFGLHLLVLLFLIFQGLNIRQLSLRKQPNFVQMVDGQAVSSTDDLARDPEMIRQFVSKTMSSIFNWSGTIPPQTIEEVSKPKPDLGILIKTPSGGSQKVTTSSWVASFGFAEDFRKGFISQIADMTPAEVFANNPQQIISGQLIIKRVYPPKQIAPGKWEVGMVADLIQNKQADGKRLIVPFNKDLLVRAIDYFDYPQADQTTVLQKAIYAVRAERLEIYEMRNLCLLDAYDNSSGAKSNQCLTEQKSGNFIR